MRETERTAQVEKKVMEEILLTKEEICSYEVDRTKKNMMVQVRLFSEDNSIMRTEVYRLFSDVFVDYPTEEELWQLIDAKRRDV